MTQEAVPAEPPASELPSPHPPSSEPPVAEGHWLTGSLRAFREGGLAFYEELWRRHGDVVNVRFGPARVTTVFHPDGIRHVLQGNHLNYQREPNTNRIFKVIAGDNLFTADGSDWLARRRRLQPAFHRKRIAAFGQIMVHRAQHETERWLVAASDGRQVDVAERMRHLTMVIVGDALFSVDFGGEARELGEQFVAGPDYFAWRTQRLFAPPLWVPIEPHRRLKRSRRILQERMQAMLEERRAAGESGKDFMGLLMDLRDEETGEPMSDEAMRAELGIMFGAGHETTAAALTWAFWLIARHPDVERALVDELREVLGERAPTVDDIAELQLTRAVVDESMRLYPPAWAISRQAREDDVVLGAHVPAGRSLTLVPYIAQRDPRFWDDPERFDPWRWIDGGAEEAVRAGAFVPFGAGPRKCIGEGFARTEAVLVLATMLRRLQLREVRGVHVIPDNGFTLRPRDGLPMRPERRA